MSSYNHFSTAILVSSNISYGQITYTMIAFYINKVDFSEIDVLCNRY